MDRINYFETLPASDDNLEFAVRLEADRLVRAGVTAEELARAKAGYLEQQRVMRTSDATLASILSHLFYANWEMATMLIWSTRSPS